MDKIEIKKIAAYSIGFLTLIAAVRLLNLGTNYGIPIFSYISFSNIIGYILDIVYGSAIFILVGISCYLLRHTLSKLFKLNGYWRLTYLLVASILASIFLYTYFNSHGGKNLTYYLRFILFFGLLFFGIFIIKTNIVHKEDINFLIGTSICIFIYIGGKVISNNDFASTFKHRSDIITFKDSSLFHSDSSKYIVANTADFVFVFNEQTSCYTAYPMSEIKSITQKREDSVPKILRTK